MWEDRFWPKVRMSGPDECWEWAGGKNLDGYGRFAVETYPKKKAKQAHHCAFFLVHGYWPKYLLHSCDNPGCCNERHLREGTHVENIRECWSKGRGHSGRRNENLHRIKVMITAGYRNCEIRDALGVRVDDVSKIRHGRLLANG